MEIIKSPQNKWLKKINALKIKKFREQYQQFVIEGIRFCREALVQEADIEGVFISEKEVDNPSIQEFREDYPGEIHIIESKLFAKNVSTVTPQGIAAIINKPRWNMEDILNKGSFFVIIDGIQDPGNLGTIIRTSFAAGVDGLFCLKGTVDVFNDKTLRSTMGSIFKLPVFTIEDHEQLLKLLKDLEVKTIIADLKATEYHFQYQYPKKVAIVLGSEGAGCQLIKEGDHLIKIPMINDIDSLNVAVAGSVILYEVLRQRMVEVVI